MSRTMGNRQRADSQTGSGVAVVRITVRAGLLPVLPLVWADRRRHSSRLFATVHLGAKGLRASEGPADPSAEISKGQTSRNPYRRRATSDVFLPVRSNQASGCLIRVGWNQLCSRVGYELAGFAPSAHPAGRIDQIQPVRNQLGFPAGVRTGRLIWSSSASDSGRRVRITVLVRHGRPDQIPNLPEAIGDEFTIRRGPPEDRYSLPQPKSGGRTRMVLEADSAAICRDPPRISGISSG